MNQPASPKSRAETRHSNADLWCRYVNKLRHQHNLKTLNMFKNSKKTFQIRDSAFWTYPCTDSNFMGARSTQVVLFYLGKRLVLVHLGRVKMIYNRNRMKSNTLQDFTRSNLGFGWIWWFCNSTLFDVTICDNTPLVLVVIWASLCTEQPFFL